MNALPPSPDPNMPGAAERVDIRLDLADCTDKASLLECFASALAFPDWFGRNWDALSDCLTDLSWLPAQHYRIELAQPQGLRTAAPEALATALEILGEAAEFWAGEGVVFEFALSETPQDLLPPAPGKPASPQ